MAYSPTTDFLALLRYGTDGARFERMPGLDYVVSAMARAGMFQLSVGQTAPTTNQANTVWLRPSVPSWVAEGVVFLWNAATVEYEPATPALWRSLLSASGYSFQAVITAADAAIVGTTILAIERAAPAATAIVLPNLAAQWASGRDLKLVDWSTAVVNHAITVTTPDGATIMHQASWQFLSSAVQLAGVTFSPVPDLNGWVITP